MYFPYGVGGSRLEKIGDKGQHSIRLSKQHRLLFYWDKTQKKKLMISELTHMIKVMASKISYYVKR